MSFLRTFVVLVLVGVLAVAAVCVWIWIDLHVPVTNPQLGQAFVVGRGETFDRILQDLKNQGLIKHSWPLRIYLKLKRQNPSVQAGNYYFPTTVTAIDVLAKLKQGGEFDRLTVVEGWTRWDIANALTRVSSFKVPNSGEALRLLDKAGLIQDLDPQARNLEGYLFPDTYFLVANSGPDEVVSQMVHRFHQVWQENLKTPAERRKMSAHQVVTIASIIETEAKLKEEREIVASVIENRLKRGMPLSMDSTLVYAAKMAGAWKYDGKVYQSDIDRQSPYNTRKNSGLPPGPVGCPGLSSLEAAVNPAHTDYIYYVRNPDRNDGAHNFYADEKGFATGVQALRAWEQHQLTTTKPQVR